MSSGGGGGQSYVAGYRYLFGIHMGICRGPVDELVEIRVGDRTAWTGNVGVTEVPPTEPAFQIDKPNLFGGEDKEGGIRGTCWVMMGKPDQVAPDILTDMNTGITAGVMSTPSLPSSGRIMAMRSDTSIAVEYRADGFVYERHGGNSSADVILPGQWHPNRPIIESVAAVSQIRFRVDHVSGSNIVWVVDVAPDGTQTKTNAWDTWLSLTTTRQVLVENFDNSALSATVTVQLGQNGSVVAECVLEFSDEELWWGGGDAGGI